MLDTEANYWLISDQTLKEKKKICMELEFMELEFQNTTIWSLKLHYKAP